MAEQDHRGREGFVLLGELVRLLSVNDCQINVLD